MNNTKIEATAVWWVIVLYTIGSLVSIAFAIGYILLVYAFIRSLVVSNVAFDGTVLALIMIIGIMLYIMANFIRLPLKTSLKGTTISTYNILGKRSINLTEIVAMKRVNIFQTPSHRGTDTRIYGIRLTTRNGKSLVLHLGSIEDARRREIYKNVLPFVAQNGVAQNSDARVAFSHWAS